MAAPKVDGNCFICGKTLGKVAMKNHILKEHAANGDEQCVLLRIEGAYAKEYWLFVDVAKNKTLDSLDDFMRRIWLECCGHMSIFKVDKHDGHDDGSYFDDDYDEDDGKTYKLKEFSVGDKITHEYDMGTTTKCLITLVGETRRQKQKDAVRLLARNVPPVFTCASCGKSAGFICQECLNECENPYYCSECAEGHVHDPDDFDSLLPITNSPRNGACGYEGECDIFAYDPDKL